MVPLTAAHAELRAADQHGCGDPVCNLHHYAALGYLEQAMAILACTGCTAVKRAMEKLHAELAEYRARATATQPWAWAVASEEGLIPHQGDTYDHVIFFHEHDANDKANEERERLWYANARPTEAECDALVNVVGLVPVEALAAPPATITAAYTERADLVALIAGLCHRLGYAAGVGADNAVEPEFQKVVFVDIPDGTGGTFQASWHVSAADHALVAHMDAYPHPWDGHSAEQKYASIREAAVAHWRAPVFDRASGSDPLGVAEDPAPEPELEAGRLPPDGSHARLLARLRGVWATDTVMAAAPGTVMKINEDSITIRCADGRMAHYSNVRPAAYLTTGSVVGIGATLGPSTGRLHVALMDGADPALPEHWLKEHLDSQWKRVARALAAAGIVGCGSHSCIFGHAPSAPTAAVPASRASPATGRRWRRATTSCGSRWRSARLPSCRPMTALHAWHCSTPTRTAFPRPRSSPRLHAIESSRQCATTSCSTISRRRGCR